MKHQKVEGEKDDIDEYVKLTTLRKELNTNSASKNTNEAPIGKKVIVFYRCFFLIESVLII